MTVPVKTPVAGDIMEQVLLKGDIAKLTPSERVQYYGEVCKSMGLNPLTKPFEFITLNGKLQLYALRSCTDQLRKINNVSLEIVSREIADDILTVHVRALMPGGRIDEDLGAVAFPSTMKGETRANAELKAVTKAKRRATLSICGLGWLDETEVEDIPASAKRPARPAPNVMLPPHDTTTGEIIEPDEPSPHTATPAADQEPAPAVLQDISAGAGQVRVPEWGEYVDRWAVMLTEATDAKQLHTTWSEQRTLRGKILWPEDDTFEQLKARVEAKIKLLKG